MRLRNSDLREDLFAINLAETPICECGNGIEDAEHFFQDCTQYNIHRAKTYLKFNVDLREYEVEDLLEGNQEWTYKLQTQHTTL